LDSWCWLTFVVSWHFGKLRRIALDFTGSIGFSILICPTIHIVMSEKPAPKTQPLLRKTNLKPHRHLGQPRSITRKRSRYGNVPGHVTTYIPIDVPSQNRMLTLSCSKTFHVTFCELLIGTGLSWPHVLTATCPCCWRCWNSLLTGTGLSYSRRSPRAFQIAIFA
jgi:hypothetical protein